MSGQREAPAVLLQGKAADVEFVAGGRGVDPLFHVPEYNEKLNCLYS
jgi:hypothetical protein